jgi:drug/metabolite transporter (DMT)-like permease
MLSPAVPSLTVAVVSSVVVTLVAGAGVPFTGWSPVGLPEMAILGGAMAAIFVGYVTSVASMRVGDLAFVAPFRYMSLVIAMLVGFVVFGEVPDGWTLVGAAIVVASGAYAFWRERRVKAAQA